MIAFVLDRLGLDPAFLVGGEVPSSGQRARGPGWLVVEGDESDRTIERLRPRIAVVTNVDLDHHSEFASRAGSLGGSSRARRRAAGRSGGGPEPVDLELAVPGEHNRRNAAAALAPSSSPVCHRRKRGPTSWSSGGGASARARGEAGGGAVLDDYAHHPAEVEATISAVRDGGRVLVLFQPHLYSRTRHLARELGDGPRGSGRGGRHRDLSSP